MSDALREIITLFGLEVDKGSFKQAEGRTDKLRRGITKLARALAGGVIANELRKIIGGTAALGDSIDKTSGKIGVETDALQELRYAGEMSGVATNTTDMALQRFGRRAAEAAKGTGEAKGALAALGVQLTDSTGRLRPTEELLGDVADGLKNAKTDGDRLRLAFKLFDSEGVAMVNMLKGGKENLEAVKAEAHALGGVLDRELIALTVEYTDEQTRLGRVIRGIKNNIARGLLPSIIQTTRGIIEWAKANREVISDAIIRGVRFFVQLIGVIGRLMLHLVQRTTAFADSLGPVASRLALVAGLFAAMAVAMGLPIALGVAIIAIFDDLVGYFEGKNSLIGRLVDFISALVENPIDPESHWAVQLLQRIVKAIQMAFDEFERFKRGFNIREEFEQLGRSGRAIGSFGMSEVGGEIATAMLNPVQQLMSSGTSLTSHNNVNVTVNAAPGQNEAEVGRQTARAVGDVVVEQYRSAIRTMIPEPTGG